MLWAMRDVVKEFQLCSPAGNRTFVEGRIVDMDIPMISFVRLGVSGLAKSQTLNQLLGNPHGHNTFVHRNMKCGNVPRKVSDGLVELSWYLPCGNSDIDRFTKPVAITNLRGDGRLLEPQISFLCQTSAAVFIFNDDQYMDFTMLTSTENKAELFLVTNSQGETFNSETLMDKCRRHNIKDKNVIINDTENGIGFVKTLDDCLSDLLANNPKKTKLKDMAAIACVEGFRVDEDGTYCNLGRQNAAQITDSIRDVMTFKKTELPQSTQQDKSSLKGEELRQKPSQMDRSKAVVKFANGLSQRTERLYFLKWLKIQMDNPSRQNLSMLRQRYKECRRNTPQNKELILHLDGQISNFLLGPEHFFRELGQLYESTYSLPENCSVRQKVQHLPALCAKVLMDGFPVALVDGDASIIPIKWISEVMNQLHTQVDSKSKILVLAVLGVQGTGKSTLLNTMFGTQFAVSSGRCTRGAFMQLIKVSEDFRSQPKCDFIMVIDTEGLKSPVLSELDTGNKYIKLATLLVGLGNITIINVDMENATETNHFLQVVVQAFLRTKEVGKNPRCVFVYQNLSEWSAHDKSMLVEQLNEMTQIAAKMEKRENNTKFTDVMKYDPDKDSYYIPGLWCGTPPMAPVSSGYSKAVSDLKNSLICSLQTSVDITPIDVTEFLMWTKILWDAVNYDNFFLTFRESLMAYVYTDLSTQYNSWEWSFQSDMRNWLTTKETLIINFGMTDKNVQINFLRTKLNEILNEASMKLHAEEQAILKKLDQYFQKKDRKVSSIEKYKKDFRESAGCLKQELECAIKDSLEKIIGIREGMEKVNTINVKRNYITEKKVCELLEDCKERKDKLSDDDLTTEFEKMWNEIIVELCDNILPVTDVYKDVRYLLQSNLSGKSRCILEMVNNVDLRNCGHEQFFVNSDWFSDLMSLRKIIFNAIWHMKRNYFVAKTQRLCNKIIKECDHTSSHHVATMKKYNTDYHETYIKDILNDIDCQIRDNPMNDKCEAYLKCHICGRVAKSFYNANSEFIVRNAPQKCLIRWKNLFLLKFLELYNESDHSQKKAEDFTDACIKPGVQDYVSKHLGQAIADEIKRGDGGVDNKRREIGAWTRAHFQVALLEQLLHENSFKMYRLYTRSYETYAKNRIFQQMIQEMSDGRMAQLEKKLISEIMRKVNHTIANISKDGSIETFIQQFCSDLEDQLVFPRDALDTFLILINGKADQFATNLMDCMKKIELALPKVYESKEDIKVRIEDLPLKPHELLLSRLCGCRHQCPFCGAPCEAGGQKHSTHFSNMHQLTAFVRCTQDDKVTKLVVQIRTCTTAVTSDLRFKSDERKRELHPCRDYKKIYPDWEIARQRDEKASDYWKFMMMRFNEEFASVYNAEPAGIPDEWKRLTVEDALRGLRRSFKIL